MEMKTRDLRKLLIFGVVIVVLIAFLVKVASKRKEKVDTTPRQASVTPPANPYLSSYSGVYHISPDGTEAFALAENGLASWVYGYPENGKIKTVEKRGTWTAQENFITVSINGNTGVIVENYRLKNGIFRNAEDQGRYLTKRQP
jgi:hypothetical protein